jgi:hypothetical protein
MEIMAPRGNPRGFFFGGNVDINVKVEGVDRLVRDLQDLGINRIPNYVARALTEIANRTQDAMIEDVRSNLHVRGNWLTKGYKYGINRKQAYKHDLTAVVRTEAPWLIEQETKTVITPRKASTLAVPRIWQRGSRTAVTRSPRYLANTFRLKTKYSNEMIAIRQGTGRLARLVPLFILRKRTPEQSRIHLIKVGTDTVSKVTSQVMSAMVQTAISESRG